MIAGVVVLGVVLAFFLLKAKNERSLRASALAQSEEAYKNKNIDLAIRHLDRLLQDSPDDIPAIEAKAKLLNEAAESSPRWYLEAANINDLLIRIDPNGEGRLETRRKLAELYILYSDAVRREAAINNVFEGEIKSLRYQAAVSIAQELIRIEEQAKPPIQDAAAHRLLAMAYMGQVPGLKAKSADDKLLPELLKNSKSQFLEALRIDPNDLMASEKLSELYLTRLNDPVAADRTLDALLEKMPNSAQVRIARYRAFNRARVVDQSRSADYAKRANVELEKAIELEPQNVLFRLMAANDALIRGDTITARHHVDAIPVDHQKEDLRVKVLRGQVEFAENHPDEAVDQWRQGLSLSLGGDGELTWQLARSLIRLGGPRLNDALPLINQYLRLSRDDRNGKGLFLQALYDQKMGHPNEAIAKLDKVVRVASKDYLADAYLSLGSCHEAIGNTDLAISAYSNASKAAPSAGLPRRAIARIRQVHNPELAVAELESALKRSREAGQREDAPLLFDLIRIRLIQQIQLPADQRRWVEVESLLERAKVVAPDESLYRNLYAEYLASSGRLDQAIKLFEASTQNKDRKFAGTWQVYSSLMERQNRRADAIRILDRGMEAENAGDHAVLRIAKAQLLINDGKGQAARDVLVKDASSLESSERPELYRALGALLRNLGDRDGVRGSYIEWARLAPESIEPALALLNFAEAYGDDESARKGLDILRSGRGKNDPFALVAQALELLRVDRSRGAVPPEDRIRMAEEVVQDLRILAPLLPSQFLLEGMILEYRGQLKEAAEKYQRANNLSEIGPALPRLIEAYMKLKAFDKLAALESKYDEVSRRIPSIGRDFAQLSMEIARKLGDKERAEYFASRLIDSKGDTVQKSTEQARLFDLMGRTADAEQKLNDLVAARPQDPTAWFALIRYRKERRSQAEAEATIKEAQKIYQGERPELFLAQCYAFAEDKAKATEFHRKAKDKRPNDLTTLRTFIEFCDATGQDEGGEEVLRRALKIDPTASWAAKRLALRITTKTDPGRWSEAWNLVAKGGDTPEDRMVRATILARSPESARRQEAIAAFEGLVDDLPIASPMAIDARVRLSQAMLDMNRPDKAWAYIAPLTDDQARVNPVALSIGVEALARTNNGNEAQKRLDRLVAIIPAWSQIPTLKAWVLMSQGKKSEASASLASAFDATAKDDEAEALGKSAVDLLIRFNDVDAAYEIARKLAKRWPRDHAVLARMQVIRREFDQALASCRIAIQSGGPDEIRQSVQYATDASVAQKASSEFLKQVEDLDKAALARSPEDYNILVNLATIAHLQARYADEMTYYYKALDLSPSNSEFLNNMAWTLSEGLGKHQEALDRVNEVILRAGVSSDFLDTRGVILSKLGDQKGAVADLEKSVKIRPLAVTYFHLARAYRRADNLADSRRCSDLAWKAGFRPESLDATDRDMLDEIMGKAKP